MSNNHISEELDRIKRICEAQAVKSMQTLVQEMPRSVMRERVDLSQMIFYGAPVISVEGEEYQMGAKIYRNVGFLGYWVMFEEMMDGWRLWFTTPEGMRFDTRGIPIKNQDYILHPLCAGGEYIVPKDGGITILDEGRLILISRTGLLRGEGGWALAQKYANKYREMLVHYQMKSQRVEEISQHINRVEEQNMQVEAEKLALIQVLRDVQNKYRLVQTNYNRFLVEKEALISQLRGMHEINSNLRVNMEQTLADLQKQIDDILTFVETEAIEDSLRASLTAYPKVVEAKAKKVKRKWKSEGISDTEEEDEALKRMQMQIQQMERQLQEQKEEYERQIQMMEERAESRAEPEVERQAPDEVGEDIGRGAREGIRQRIEEEYGTGEPEPEEGEE